MDAAQWVTAHDLDEAFARVQLAECILEFRRQRVTQDIWCVQAGPLGTIAIPIIPDFAIDVRLRGGEMVGTYLFADGSPFGGFGGHLPTRRTLAPHLRLLDWLRGRRGSGGIEYAVHRDRP